MFLSVLREFRDSVLAGFPEGQEWIRKYNSHSAEVIQLVADNPDLGLQMGVMMVKVIPAVQSVLEHQPLVLTEAVWNDMMKTLNQMKWLGSPKLKIDLEDFEARITSPVR